MKRTTILVCFFLFLTHALTAQEVKTINKIQLQSEGGKWMKIEGDRKYLVDDGAFTIKLKEKVDQTSFLKKYDLVLIRKSKLEFIDVKVPSGTKFIDIVEKISKDQDIQILDINTFGQYDAIPNDADYSLQWHLPKIGMPAVWDMLTPGTCIDIAVIDSGVQIDHPDIGNGTDGYNTLWANSGEDAWTNPNDPTTGNGVDNDGNGLVDDWRGFDFDGNDNNITSTVEHGTRVAGIVAAKTNNASRGVAGVGGGWGGQGFRIMGIRVGDTPNGGVLDDAILYAVNEGADVIQLSLTVGQTAAIDAAIATAVASGIPVVCASGNAYAATVSYPASNANVIAVGSTETNDTKSDFSNYGTAMFIAAPGRGIRSTTLTSTYGNADGTSFAAPQVSATVGLLHQINPSLTVAQFRNILSATADKTGGYNYSWDATRPGHSQELGFGRLNSMKAVERALGGPITGPSYVCSNMTFTLTGTAPGSVSWSSSAPSILSINSSTGAATITGTGQVTITATIALSCGSGKLTKTVWVGLPQNNYGYYVSSGSNYGLVEGETELYQNAICWTGNPTTGNAYTTNSGASSVTWSKLYSTPSTLIWSSPSSGNLSITFKALSDRGTFRLALTNSCGTVNKVYEFKPVSCGAFIAYPNPATDILTLEFENTERLETLPGEIRLLSERTQEVVKTADVVDTYNKRLFVDGTKIELRVSDLPRGTYYIHSIPQKNSNQEVEKVRIILE